MTSLSPLNVNLSSSSYQAMLGVGGIGSGTFFELNGETSLGREESRSGHFIERRDYCKLHIISHYVKVLLGAGFATLPVGKVGADETGQHLLAEMGAVGLDLRHVQTVPGAPTLFSFCFLYPDGSGGNLTTDNSACDRMGPQDVSQAEPDFKAYRSHGIALAAPEVPLAARQALLQMGTDYAFWRVAAFTSTEILPAIAQGLLAQVDLLALNLDEAAALVGRPSQAGPGSLQSLLDAAFDRLRAANPALKVTITAGKQGSWSLDGRAVKHVPAYPVTPLSTAGAGDAFLAGLIAGQVAGLELADAQLLATLVAARSITSPHTIDPTLDRLSLRTFAAEHALALPGSVRHLLQDPQALAANP
jgi:ribokinase